jgi:predicted glycoside hydrolase/deacetylase ChbG (UPF0249 family)
VPSLVHANGRFCPGWQTLLVRILTGTINFAEVQKELEAQIIKVLDAGIIPTHIDSHQYIHLFPKISAIVAFLAHKYRIRNIRYPKESWGIQPTSLSSICRKTLLLLPLYCAKRDFKKNNLHCSDDFMGFGSSGRLNTLSLKTYIQKIRAGTTEMVCHPGEDMQDPLYRRWGYCWKQELDTLRDREVKLLLQTSGITLTNYKYV